VNVTHSLFERWSLTIFHFVSESGEVQAMTEKQSNDDGDTTDNAPPLSPRDNEQSANISSKGKERDEYKGGAGRGGGEAVPVLPLVALPTTTASESVVESQSVPSLASSESPVIAISDPLLSIPTTTPPPAPPPILVPNTSLVNTARKYLPRGSPLVSHERGDKDNLRDRERELEKGDIAMQLTGMVSLAITQRRFEMGEGGFDSDEDSSDWDSEGTSWVRTHCISFVARQCQ
jgi:hypothetical protein